MLIAIALIALAAPAAPASDAGLELEAVGAGSDGGPVFSCGGDAPADHYCVTGEHDAATLFLHGFASPFPTAATLESRIHHDGGTLYFRCTYLLGETQNCVVTGEQPPLTGTVFHDCYAYYPNTAGLFPAGPGEPSGVPGGLGPWTCLIV